MMKQDRTPKREKKSTSPLRRCDWVVSLVAVFTTAMLLLTHGVNAGQCKVCKSAKECYKNAPGCNYTEKPETFYPTMHGVQPPFGWLNPSVNQLGTGNMVPSFEYPFQGTAGEGDGKGGSSAGSGGGLPQFPFGKPGGGGGGGGGGGDDGGDDGDDDTGDGCDKNNDGVDDRQDLNKDGVPDDNQTILGDTIDIAPGANVANQCGIAVQMGSNLVTLTEGQNAAAIIRSKDNNLYAYTRAGNNLNFSKTSGIPKFYCILIDTGEVDPDTGLTIKTVEKVFIKPDDQFHSISNESKFVPVSMRGVESDAVTGGGFIIMKRNGGGLTFTPPAPNPEWFIAQGAIDVDPNCYSVDHLFKLLPADFGDLMIQSGSRGYTTLRTSAVDKAGCEAKLHYFDLEHMQLYYKPDQTIKMGTVTGGIADKEVLAAANPGSFVSNTDGEILYNGSTTLMRSQVGFFLGVRTNSMNEQTLLAGAWFRHPNGNVIRVNSPGRIKSYISGTKGIVVLTDGGWVEDEGGTTLRTIAPGAAVEFPVDEPIIGYSNGEMVMDPTNMIPTNDYKPGVAQGRLPYDTSVDPCAN